MYYHESIWFNATLTILDQKGIGYCYFAAPPPSKMLQQWSLVQLSQYPTDTWPGIGAPNYALDAAGVVLVNHMGGRSYSDWLLNPLTSPTPSPSPTPTPASTNSSILVIIAIVVAIVVVLIIVVISRARVRKL